MTAVKSTLSCIICAAMYCGSDDCRAASMLAFAKVELVPAIDIEQTREVDFGTINNVDGICEMTSGGMLSGSEGMDCTGNETPGEFTISGQDGASIILSVTAGQTNGVTFTPALVGSNIRTLENGIANITVLGALQLSGALDGMNTVSYTITANYE